MSLVCGQCSRVNPSEAAYCFYDGAALAGRAGGPINAGAAPFPNPFVFPSGLQCRNFDQLASACQQNWSAALDLLKQGYLGSFFGGMGRVDLALAAQEAAKFPDLERGLDQLIGKLPSQAVQEPKLQAEPTDISLGLVKIGADRTAELHLANLGMRLLYGTATSDSKWLTLGDAPGHAEKMFQFSSETTIPVQLRGQHLRAGSKPVEGHLILDSNGGTVTVTFRADVPITPYAGGLFAGAVTPRQVAEKAKANPKEAAPYFENGDTAKWYALNGWAYPVIGPTMPGMGGIQQFFEALGVAQPPKVDFAPKALDLEGAVGKTIEASIEVAEIGAGKRKVVYGWASCDQPWVEIGKSKLTSKNAVVPITIRIPNPCPPTLEATIHVVGNGNQKADVPLKIKVAGGKAGVQLQREEEFVALEIVEDDAPLSVSIVEDDAPASKPTVPQPTVMPAANAPLPVEMVEEESPFSIVAGPAPSKPGSAAAATTIPKPAERLPLPIRLGLHLVPVALLGLCVLVLIAIDIFSKTPLPRPDGGGGGGGGGGDGDVDKAALVILKFDEGKIDKDYNDTMNWAIHINPKDKNAPPIKLNYYLNGSGNTIVVKIDNKDHVFGEPPTHGHWYKDKTVDHSKGGIAVGRPGYGGKKRTFVLSGDIRVTQTVTIEPSDPIEVKPGDYKRFLATALVRYKIENKTKGTHKIGLRILMDTYINDRDDVPFLLPGVNEPVKDKKRLIGAEVPGFVQVIEKTSVRDPGIVLHMGLRISDKIEPPDEFMLTRFPGYGVGKKWNVEYTDITKKEGRDTFPDSSVVLFWNPKEVLAGNSRELGFTYGLGSVSADGDKLGLTVGGSFQVGGDLTVVALVSDPKAKTVTLKLPAGMTLPDKQTLTQDVPLMRAGRPSPVTWRVRTGAAGARQISVSTDTNLHQSRRVTISDRSLFN